MRFTSAVCAAPAALQANLEGTATATGSTSLVLASAASAPGYSSLFGVGGSGAAGGPAAATAGGVPGLSEEQAAAERCSLLNILTLIYYHPR